MARVMILRRVSPTPIGLIPGHLSSAISLPASRAEVQMGSTYSVHKRLETEAMAAQRSDDDSPKEEHSLFQAVVSNPDGPAAPSI